MFLPVSNVQPFTHSRFPEFTGDALFLWRSHAYYQSTTYFTPEYVPATELLPRSPNEHSIRPQGKANDGLRYVQTDTA